MRYVKINRKDVLNEMISVATSGNVPVGGAVCVMDLANHLNTSRYQVEKCLEQLVEEKLVVKKCEVIRVDGKEYPPMGVYELAIPEQRIC